MMPCRDPESAALYARGYPYLVTLVEGHKDDKKAVANVARAFKNYWGPYHSAWPHLTAIAFARGSAARVEDWDEAAVAKAASVPGPITADEAKAIVAGWFARKGSGNFNETRHELFVLEALVGTDVVLPLVVSELEKVPLKPRKKSDDDDDDGGGRALVAYLTGFLLLRATPAVAKAARAKLESVYQAAVAAKQDVGEHTVRGGLDLGLHGNEGAARTLAGSHWQYWYYYLMVDDPKVHLARLADNYKSDWVPESRILYLAGPEMWPVYTSKKALRQGKRLPDFLRDFSLFDDDSGLDLVLDMVGVKGAGDVPAEFFKRYGASVREKLTRISRTGSARAEKASAALKLV
jgi:hypothetical protein